MSIITKDDLKSKIYTIRGVPVMLDFPAERGVEQKKPNLQSNYSHPKSKPAIAIRFSEAQLTISNH
jgi:hypothetical protein